MMLLGAGFGLGVALTLSRLFADLAPQWALGGAIGGAVVGLAAALWVVGVRGLLHDRAVLDRWVAEVTTGLRTAMEEWVATRVLAAEASLGRAAAERDAVERRRYGRSARPDRPGNPRIWGAAGAGRRGPGPARTGDRAGFGGAARRNGGAGSLKSPDYGFLNRSCE